MATDKEQREFDLKWIEEHMGINPLTTSKAEAHEILRKHEINTTSWYLPDWKKNMAQSGERITA